MSFVGTTVDDGGFSRVVERQPYCDWNVVRRGAVGDGERAMEAEEKLCAPVVVGVDLRLRAEGRMRRGRRGRLAVCGQVICISERWRRASLQ